MGTRKEAYWKSVKKREGGEVYEKGEKTITEVKPAKWPTPADLLTIVAIVTSVEVIMALIRAAN